MRQIQNAFRTSSIDIEINLYMFGTHPNVIIVLREVSLGGRRFLQLFPNVKASPGMATFEGLFEARLCRIGIVLGKLEALTVIIKSQTTTLDV